MKEKRAFKRIRERVKADNEIFVDLGLDFVKQIKYSMSIHPTVKTQKDLAKALNKEESEVSKWMTGLHNLTFDNVSKIMAILGRDMLIGQIHK